MPTQRKTCHGCPHLDYGILHEIRAYFCRKTEKIVPQDSNPQSTTLWRVPTNCPLPDTEVLKSEDKAPEEEWVVIQLEKEQSP